MSGWVGCSYCGYRVPVENINAPFNWNHECLPKSDNESKMTTPKTPEQWADEFFPDIPELSRMVLIRTIRQAMAEAREEGYSQGYDQGAKDENDLLTQENKKDKE